MLTSSGTRRKHQAGYDAATKQTSVATTLSGWAGIEDHLIKHDVGMIQDYADDIDTLLVFAGLFSAVLTAFVVETYTSLQPDGADTTNQLLAYGFASQLGKLTSSAEFNATISSILSSSAFTAPRSARWINSLFFISLVLSLAAALFGIMAKQWLREYLLWNFPLGAPRENVLVRQIRFEAWEAWNVAATISVIPALLELAMILFLVGIVILMWTLDNVVAIAVTAAVAAFLGTVATFTILPVCFKRCPYKSPTAWACVRLAGYVWPLNSSPATNGALKHGSAQSWRQRDLESCRIVSKSGWWTRQDNIRSAVKLELAREKSHLDEKGGVIKDPWTIFVPDEETDALLTDLSEMVPLLQALSWVKLASQDSRVVRYVDECMETIHWNPDLSLKSHGGIDLVGIRAAADWFILSSLCTTEPSDSLNFQHLLSMPEDDRFTSHVTELRRQFGSALRHGNLTDGSPFVLTRAGKAGHERDPLIGWMHERPILGQYICNILSQDVHLAIAKVSEFQKGISPELLRNARRAVDLFYTLSDIYTMSCSAPILMDGSDHLLEALRDVLGDEDIMAILDVCCSGLTYATFICAWKWFRVTGTSSESDKGRSLAIERKQDPHSYKPRGDIETLLLHYFDHDFGACSRDVLNMFIRACIDWLWRIYIDSGPDCLELDPPNHEKILSRMIDAASAALQRNSRTFCLSSTDDGSDEAWVNALFHNKKWLRTYHPALFASLLHTLEQSYCTHALVGDPAQIRVHLHRCLEAIHLDKDQPCPDSNCSWITPHRCLLGSRWADVGHRWIDIDCPKLPRPPRITISQNKRLRLRPLNQHIIPEGWPIRDLPMSYDVSSEESLNLYDSPAKVASLDAAVRIPIGMHILPPPPPALILPNNDRLPARMRVDSGSGGIGSPIDRRVVSFAENDDNWSLDGLWDGASWDERYDIEFIADNEELSQRASDNLGAITSDYPYGSSFSSDSWSLIESPENFHAQIATRTHTEAVALQPIESAPSLVSDSAGHLTGMAYKRAARIFTFSDEDPMSELPSPMSALSPEPGDEAGGHMRRASPDVLGTPVLEASLGPRVKDVPFAVTMTLPSLNQSSGCL